MLVPISKMSFAVIFLLDVASADIQEKSFCRFTLSTKTMDLTMIHIMAVTIQNTMSMAMRVIMVKDTAAIMDIKSMAVTFCEL